MNQKLNRISLVGLFWWGCCVFSCSTSPEKVPTEMSNSLSVSEGQPNLESQGNQIAQQSFEALSRQLKSAVQTQGIQEAIRYCNVRAIPITDSLSKEYEVKIRRISDKPRNPANALSAQDSVIFAEFEAHPKRTSKLEGTVFYKSILTQPLCLNCHGEIGKTLPPKNHQIITELYPEDKAVGYESNQLRGLWKIEFISEK